MKLLNGFQKKVIETKHKVSDLKIYAALEMAYVKQVYTIFKYKGVKIYSNKKLKGLQGVDYYDLADMLIEKEILKYEELCGKEYSSKMLDHIWVALKRKSELPEKNGFFMALNYNLGQTKLEEEMKKFIESYLKENPKSSFERVYEYCLEEFVQYELNKNSLPSNFLGLLNRQVG